MNDNLNNDFLILKRLFDRILLHLENLTDKTFQERMEIINKAVREIKSKEEQLERKYNEEEFKIIKAGLQDCSKQIRKNFDNIIIEKKDEQEKISIELSNLLNKKKLANYQR